MAHPTLDFASPVLGRRSEIPKHSSTEWFVCDVTPPRNHDEKFLMRWDDGAASGKQQRQKLKEQGEKMPWVGI